MAGRRLRVLVVGPFLPYPPTDGQRVRTWHLTRRLAAAHDVTLATWVPAGAASDHLEEVRHALPDLIPLNLDHPRPGLLRRVERRARFLAGGLPPYVQAMREEREGSLPQLASQVRHRHADRPFDLVILEEEAMAWLPLPNLGCPVVIHRLNVFTKVIGDVRPLHVGPRLAHQIEVPLWRRFDQRTSHRASWSIASTTESADELRRLTPGLPVGVVANGVDMRPLPSRPSDGTDVMFVGWMGYPPNVDAAVWFARDVWPKVITQSPRSVLRLVGRNPDPAVLALEGPHVHVTGTVADVVEACRGARVAVAPLRGGMGIKNKTLEGMAMGLPVVSTPTGAEGIAATKDDGLLVASEPDDLAALLSMLLADGELSDRLGAAARQFVSRHFDWNRVGDDYEALVADISSS